VHKMNVLKLLALTSRCCDLQMTFAAIETEGLLSEVLKHLEQIADLLSCGAVSRSWRAASNDVQPSNLVIGQGFGTRIGLAGMKGILQWLQNKHLQQRLQNTQGLGLVLGSGFAPECFKERRSMAFCQSVLTLAGCCRLARCYLIGKLCLETAASLLPVTMQELQLRIHGELPDCISLSIFERLHNLKSLIIWPDLANFEPTVYALLDAKLESLQTLVIRERSLRVDDAFSLAAHLPNLQSLDAVISVQQFQGVLTHACLRHADLELLAYPWSEDNALAAAPSYAFRVEACSNLNSLTLSLGEPMDVQLDIAKHDLEFDCVGVNVRYRTKSSFAPLVYKA